MLEILLMLFGLALDPSGPSPQPQPSPDPGGPAPT